MDGGDGNKPEKPVHTIAILSWMAFVSAIMRPGPTERDLGLNTLVQINCLFAAMIEAGTLETGKDSKLRRPTRIIAVITFVVMLASTAHFHP